MPSLAVLLGDWLPPSAVAVKPRTLDSRLRGIRWPLSRLEAKRLAERPHVNLLQEFGRQHAMLTVEWYQDHDAIDSWQNEGGA